MPCLIISTLWTPWLCPSRTSCDKQMGRDQRKTIWSEQRRLLFTNIYFSALCFGEWGYISWCFCSSNNRTGCTWISPHGKSQKIGEVVFRRLLGMVLARFSPSWNCKKRFWVMDDKEPVHISSTRFSLSVYEPLDWSVYPSAALLMGCIFTECRACQVHPSDEGSHGWQRIGAAILPRKTPVCNFHRITAYSNF